MASERRSWLDGPGAGRSREPGSYPGSRLGLPEVGPGSVATTGKRIAAFVIDVVIASLAGRIFDRAMTHPSPAAQSVVSNATFIVMYAVLLSVAGQTIGMRVLKIRVAPAGALRFAWPVAVTIRTLLLALLLPALIFDRDGRGWHDRAAGTVVLQA